MTIRPLADRVVIKNVEAAETTKSGIILTASAQEKPSVAEVVAVGPGGMVEGKEVKMLVKVGDKVLISKYSGNEVKVDGEEYSIVRQDDILAVVEGSEDPKPAAKSEPKTADTETEKPKRGRAAAAKPAAKRGGRKPAAETAAKKTGKKTAAETAAKKPGRRSGKKPQNA